MGHYERLSALDASFLELEDDTSHMHVAATLVFDGGPLRAPRGGLDIERIRAYVESRLYLVPRYRQRLAWVPVEGHPVWVDDARFNLFYHVRHTALPQPGEERQLKRLCGRILSQKLDLTKPLWELWVIEGLCDDRFALVAKAHHAMVDGIAGMDLLMLLLTSIPQHDVDPPQPWQPRPAPTAGELLAAEVGRRGGGAMLLARHAMRALADPQATVASAWDTVAGIVEALAPGASPASPTPLNPTLGPHRRFDWLRVDLAEAKRIKNALGGTVNDVVLATVAGATRRFLGQRGVSLEGLDFRAMVPVSLHAGPTSGAMGNQVVNFVVQLRIDEPDPGIRYRQIVDATATHKGSRAIQASEVVEAMADWTAAALLTQLQRVAAERRAYNVIVTNIPGPQTPLYMLEAPLREAYPMVPLYQTQGVGIALFSYDGGLFWGLNADWDALPDLHDLVEALRAEFETLKATARLHCSAA